MKRISIYCLLMFCALLTASAQQTKQLVILHTSDTHSRIEPIDLHAADRMQGRAVWYAALLSERFPYQESGCPAF